MEEGQAAVPSERSSERKMIPASSPTPFRLSTIAIVRSRFAISYIPLAALQDTQLLLYSRFSYLHLGPTFTSSTPQPEGVEDSRTNKMASGYRLSAKSGWRSNQGSTAVRFEGDKLSLDRSRTVWEIREADRRRRWNEAFAGS
jgi:hypothetical protein